MNYRTPLPAERRNQTTLIVFLCSKSSVRKCSMSETQDPCPLPADWVSFHGQMLINWLVSAFCEDNYLCGVLKSQDFKLLAAQFCTHLLAAGVLHQLPHKDVPQTETLFRPDLIYYWSHTEAVNTSSQKQNDSEKNIITELARTVQELKQRIEELERVVQENERSKTSVPVSPSCLSISLRSGGDKGPAEPAARAGPGPQGAPGPSDEILTIFRKQRVNPPHPMRPLFWSRVVVPPSHLENKSVPLWGELEEVRVENIEEFAQLFSRQVEAKKSPKKVAKPTKDQVIKILDSKRSHNVGILAQSLHLDFSEIENAVYNFDSSIVSLESLQQIYEMRATEEELSQLRAHAASNSDHPLDKPEQFLLELAEIPHFAERISCFMFQRDFSDNIAGISSKLDNIKSTCQFLMSSENLKTVLGIILTLGNFMNGGNMQRGQADGFGLEILAKLKDVKSKDNSTTLLNFIVVTYMRKCGDAAATDAKLPVPEPSDIEKASAVQFDEVEKQLLNLEAEMNGYQKKMEVVLPKSQEENIQTFKEKIESFLDSARKQLAEGFENYEECKRKFHSLLQYFQFHPKGGIKEEEVAPKDFFPFWASFCSDFKALWQKEQQRIIKEKLKQTKKEQYVRKKEEIKTKPMDPAGLKAKILRMKELRKKKS